MLRIEGFVIYWHGSIMRWIPGVILLSLVMALDSGCQQKVFVTEPDLKTANGMLSVHLEHDPMAGATAITPPVGAPLSEAARSHRHGFGKRHRQLQRFVRRRA